MGYLPFFWKRPIFLPAATSRKREWLLEARRRDLVIAAGARETELQHPPQFAVDSPGLSVTCRRIGDILTGC
jgi:hypothetical protein